MATVMHGRTTIVIAHRPGTIARPTRCVLLDGGRVAAPGTHDELLATSARYRDVLAAWAEHASPAPPARPPAPRRPTTRRRHADVLAMGRAAP